MIKWCIENIREALKCLPDFDIDTLNSELELFINKKRVSLNDLAVFVSFVDGCVAYPYDVLSLPATKAIYQICGKETLYIGHTTNLKRRFIGGHHVDKYIFSDPDTNEITLDGGCLALTWANCESLDINEIKQIEKAVIKARNPKYNQAGVPMPQINNR